MSEDKNGVTIEPTKGGIKVYLRWPMLLVFAAGMLAASTLGTKALSWLFPQLDVGNKERIQLREKVAVLERKAEDRDQDLQNCKAVVDFFMKHNGADRMTPEAPPNCRILTPRHHASTTPSITPQSGVTTPASEAVD